jgi:fimbrial chaperone protein
MIQRRALPLLAALALAPPLAGAGELEVAPTAVELSGATPTALVALKNDGAKAMRYQIRAYVWAQEPSGEMRLTPARDLVLFPPLLELAPGESRNVRVGTRAQTAAAERTWRMFIEEMPRADESPSQARVEVLTRIGVPVYLAPAKRVEKAELVFLPGAPGKLRFTLRNTGTVRIRPTGVTLALVGADGTKLAERTLEAWYVLAGGERIYEAEVPADACAAAREAIAIASVEGGAIEARIASPCRAP